jgi:hypothetical protein
MSTVTVQTISNGTVSTSSANVIQGSAKAWVNFNGTGTPAIRASYNVSSITDNGTGDYTINFTNAFADTSYSWTGMAADAAGGGSIPYNLPSVGQRTFAPTTTTLRIATAYQQSAAGSDFPTVMVQVFR